MDTILDTTKHRDKIILLVEFFKSEFEERNKEFAEALKKNIDCEHIDKIVLFYENSLDEYPDISYSPKIEIAYTKKRMTFGDYFTYCNNNFNDNICVVANSDIYFDDSIKHVYSMNENDFLCITRWNNGILQGHSAYSQDVWVFRKKIPDNMMCYCDFQLGKQQCDNRVAFLAMRSGFNIINPCYLVKCHHLHKDPNQITYKRDDIHKDLARLSSIEPTDRIEYEPSNVGGFVGSFFGNKYIEFFRNELNELESNKLQNTL